MTKKSGEISVTKQMLEDTRDEILHKVTSLELRINSRFENVDSRFEKLDSKLEDVLAAVNRVAVLVEDQNERNRYVLDGLMNVTQRQDQFEKDVYERLESVEDVISKTPRGNN